jgi:hypothetical protein
MAQTIHCDGEGHADAHADVLVTMTANGDTSAWCNDHYLQFCAAVVQAAMAAEAELEANDQAALANLEGVTPGPGEAADQGEPAPSPEADPAAGFPGYTSPGPEGDQPLQGDLGGSETGEGVQAAPEPTPELVAVPGGPAGATDDPGGSPVSS